MNILEKLNPEEQALYKEMQYLCGQLVDPPPMIIPLLSVEVINPRTQEIEDKREGLMRTFLRNYFNMYAAMACGLDETGTGTFGDGHLNVKETDGGIGGIPTFDESPRSAGFGVDTYGIIIGRGPAVFSFEDFVLDNPIDHGTGANQMIHYDMFNPVQAWDVGPPREWTQTVKRYFVNRSGGSITVTEVAYVKGGGQIVLYSRDVLAPSVAIADDKACKVVFTFTSVTWPS